MAGTYTTPPISRGPYGGETTTRERWRLHSLQRIPFAPSFYYGIRVDNGQLVQVHEHGLEIDPAPTPAAETEQKPATGTKEGNPS